MDPVSPLQISIRQILAAALLAQMAFLGLVALGYIALSIGGSFRRNWPQLIVFVLLLVATIIVPSITQESSADRQALLNAAWIPTISGLAAVMFLLTADLAAVCALVILSGGSVSSCFSPLYFLLPTLTILLLRHDAAYFVKVYIWIVAGLFFVSAFLHRAYLTRIRRISESYHLAALDESVSVPNKIAYALISLACFLLSLYISNQTR